MARNNERSSGRRGAKDAARRTKKKPCALCKDKVEWVDYKDVGMLRKYMSDRGKIRSRRVTGNCAQHQRALAQAIKTARELVLLPYTQRTVTERPSGRGRDRGERGTPEARGPRREARESEVEEAGPEEAGPEEAGAEAMGDAAEAGDAGDADEETGADA